MQLIAWPPQDELQQQQPGEELPLHVLDTTVTDAAGVFEVGISADDAVLYAEADSIGLDVELYIEGRSTPVGFTTTPGQLTGRLPPHTVPDIVV